MAKLPTHVFVGYLEQSGLVPEEVLSHSLDGLRREFGGELPDDAEVVADHLVDSGLITRWHADKLFDAKYKGFYLGKYKLLKLLGSGEMGSVYLAEHVLIKHLRAIKILPKSRVYAPTSHRELFYLEGLATARFDHPNLVRAFDIDNDGDQHFFVMEYVDGKTLQSMVDENGPLPFDVACNFIAQAAEGLGYAHQHGVVHCDVKPANIMVDQQGMVRVLDLGLALHANAWRDSLSAAHREEILRTANYLSPEQLVDSHKVDLRTDIYNLGCTFYFLLTGRPPFTAASLFQNAALHMLTMPVNVAESRPDCPEDLSAICRKMLQKNPDLRYQTMDEVVDALEACLHNHGFKLNLVHSQVTAMKAKPLKRSKISERILGSLPKRYQPGSSPTIPEFPLPGRGVSIGRIFLVCVIGAILMAAVAMLKVWLGRS